MQVNRRGLVVRTLCLWKCCSMPAEESFLLSCFNRLIETIEQLAGGGAGLVSCWINKPNIIIITFVSFVQNKDIKGLFITMFNWLIYSATYQPWGGGGGIENNAPHWWLSDVITSLVCLFLVFVNVWWYGCI